MLDRRVIALLVVVLVAGGGLAAYWFAPRTSQAPDFALTSTAWENGNATMPVNFTLQDYRGDVVVLDFMAVMCTSCRIVTNDVLKPLHAQNITIVSIDTWADPATGNVFGAETEENLIRLQRDEDIPWRHALDTDQVYRKYAAVALPKIVVVDPDGGIAYTVTGSISYGKVSAAVEAARSGSVQESIPQSSLIGLAAAAGIASFFAPCAIGLLPAYLGVLLRSRETNPVAGGLKVTLGMVAGYAAVTIALVVAAALGAADALRDILPELELVMGLLLVALGILLLSGFDWSRLARLLHAGTPDGRRSLPAFGLGYAVASIACTGPILLPILLAGLGRGILGLVTVFAVYAASLAIFLLATTFLVAGGKRGAADFLIRHAPAVSRMSAVLILIGGAYLIAFYATALR